MAERLELLISERRIRARTAQLARRIDADYRGRPLSLVVVLKGAVVFAADLMRQITIPSTLDFIAASSYGAATRSSGEVALCGLDGLDISGRAVLVVEDILDSGRTTAAILDALRQRGPASLAFCALLRKPAAARARSAGRLCRLRHSRRISSSAGAWITPSATAICAASTASSSTAAADLTRPANRAAAAGRVPGGFPGSHLPPERCSGGISLGNS